MVYSGFLTGLKHAANLAIFPDFCKHLHLQPVPIRGESSPPNSSEPSPFPPFFSILQSCTHQRCISCVRSSKCRVNTDIWELALGSIQILIKCSTHEWNYHPPVCQGVNMLISRFWLRLCLNPSGWAGPVLLYCPLVEEPSSVCRFLTAATGRKEKRMFMVNQI